MGFMENVATNQMSELNHSTGSKVPFVGAIETNGGQTCVALLQSSQKPRKRLCIYHLDQIGSGPKMAHFFVDFEKSVGG